MKEGEWEQLDKFWNTVVANPPGEMKCPGGVMQLHTELTAVAYDTNGVERDRRVVKDRKVTNEFVNLLVDAMHSSAGGIHTFQYHWSGTGTDAESQTDTDLLAGTSQSGHVLGTGTTSTGGANIYSSVATVTYTTTSTGLVVSEHGLFNATSDTDAANILGDRSVFTGITVQNGWQIQFTFEMTFTAGG